MIPSRSALFLICSMSSATVFAQDIPDTRLRAMLNDNWPGLVDPNGFINWDLHAQAIQTPTALYLNSTGHLQPGEELDMTGIDLLVGFYGMALQGTGAGVNTYFIPAFPYFQGNDVSFTLAGINPADLYGQSVMVPYGINRYGLLDAGVIGPSFYIPQSGLSYLTITGCDQVDGAGWDMPSYLTGLEIRNTPIQSFPDLTGVYDLVWLIGCGLTETPTNYYPNVSVIDLSQNPITSWMPFPAALHTLELNECGLTDLPPGIPETLVSLRINGNPITNQLALPPQLVALYASDCGWEMLPPLPPTLRVLYAENSGLITLPADFPDLDYLDLSGNPGLTCIPDMPSTLDLTDLSGTSITCIPHWNSGWSFQPAWLNSSICGILDECPSLVPRIEGTTFHDDNADGIRDPGEAGLPFCSVKLQPAGWIAGVDANGHYSVYVTPGTYTITGQPRAYHDTTSSAQTPWVNQNNLVDSLNDIGYVQLVEAADLAVDVTSSLVRSNGYSSLHLTAFNPGSIAVTAELALLFDGQLQWNTTSVPPLTQSGNSATWQVTVPAGGSWSANVSLITPGILPGTPVTHTLTAITQETDAAPENNVSIWTGIVFGSYDPNMIVVQPEQITPEELASGERVTYTVYFQNTGNYPAERVVISDTLSTDLDWTTTAFLASSHPCTWYIVNGVLMVWFDPIDLPDSTNNEPESHGFVKFSFVPSSSLMIGDQVGNTANIYFDFNEPVITNDAVFTVEASTDVAEEVDDGIVLFPSPAEGSITVAGLWPGTKQLVVRDALGRTVMLASTNELQSTIPIHTWPAGSYSLQVLDGDRSVVRTFVKR